jgi:hypothetical protein
MRSITYLRVAAWLVGDRELTTLASRRSSVCRASRSAFPCARNSTVAAREVGDALDVLLAHALVCVRARQPRGLHGSGNGIRIGVEPPTTIAECLVADHGSRPSQHEVEEREREQALGHSDPLSNPLLPLGWVRDEQRSC